MNKPYHKRPDWILKAIGYYCDNYILDGQDLRKFKRGAISYYKKWSKDLSDKSLFAAFTWSLSREGLAFWAGLYGLMTEEVLLDDAPSPWTNYEKRKIAKLPEVK